VWDQIAADARKYDELPPFVEGPYSYFIFSTLQARRYAESTKGGPGLEIVRQHKKQKEERDDLLSLAAKFDELVRHYQRFARRYRQEPPSPDGMPRPPSESQRLLEWLEREARVVRQMADRDTRDSDFDFDRIPVRISRQSGGKGKRSRSRQVGVFAQKMVNCMYRACGEPRYQAVATMTNIAFPDACVVAEDVRWFCRAATRKGRSGRTGALSQ
jgi:hypothetical protein